MELRRRARICQLAVRFSCRKLLAFFGELSNMPETYDCIRQLHWVGRRARWERREARKISEKSHSTVTGKNERYIDLSQRRVQERWGEKKKTYKLCFRRRKVFPWHFPSCDERGGGEKCNKGDFMRNIKKQKKKSQYLWTSTHAEKSSRSPCPVLLRPAACRIGKI